MLSRVADSLYWMSRYMKRTDSVLRMLKVNYASSQDNTGFTWQPVLMIFTHLDEEKISAMEHNTREVLDYMVCGKDNTNSVTNLVTKARENARSIQDNITKELWQCLNESYHLVRDERIPNSLQHGDPISSLDTLVRQSMLYTGIAESTMFRGQGFCFMCIGKYLELATQAADILDVKLRELSYDLDKPMDITYWKYLLLSISGYALYLKTYRSGFEARNVFDLMVFNSTFPQSMLYSVIRLERYIELLRDSSDPESFERVRFLIGKLRSKIQYATLETVEAMGLKEFLINTRKDLFEIGHALNQHYFAYS